MISTAGVQMRGGARPDLKSACRRRISCFFSGGRDSALACFIAKMQCPHSEFALVFLDTGISTAATRRYVEEYARWLGAELEVYKTPYDYFDLASKYGYPHVFNRRWCFEFLKQAPMCALVSAEYRRGYRIDDIAWVMGVRKNESLFRLSRYDRSVYYMRQRTRFCSFTRLYWLPLLHMPDEERDRLLRLYGIPWNPLWDVGISGECLCLAGTTYKTFLSLVEYLSRHEPEMLEVLKNGDERVQQARKTKEPAYVRPLLERRVTLSAFLDGFARGRQDAEHNGG